MPLHCPPRVRAILRHLLNSYEYAKDLRRSVWDFALEIEGLRAAGFTNSEFRWLVCQGLAAHAVETTRADDPARSFHKGGEQIFCEKTSFILTETGAELAARLFGSADAFTPRWDNDRQQLRLGDMIVKEFKLPAPNQETILAAMQEENWPPRIDDPLPPQPDQDARRRLHDTINSLNRKQRHRMIRFRGDGRGQGVRWELIHDARELAPRASDEPDVLPVNVAPLA